MGGLRHGILGVLAGNPAHGYEVKNRFEEMLGGAWPVNIGQIYSTFQRLERDGLIKAIGERGDRGRQTYELTSKGQWELSEWLREPTEVNAPLHEDFHLRLLLTSRLAGPRPVEIVRSQRQVFMQRLKDLTALRKSAQASGRDDLALLVRGALLHTEADLKWLEECEAEVSHR